MKSELKFTLTRHLDHLRRLERTRPKAERRRTPSMRELSAAIGFHPNSLLNLSSNGTALSFVTGAKIILELRRRGFPTEVGDLLEYYEVAELEKHKS